MIDTIQIKELIESKDYETLFALIMMKMSRRQAVELAIYAAESVTSLYKGDHELPQIAIKAAKRCLEENFSEESVTDASIIANNTVLGAGTKSRTHDADYRQSHYAWCSIFAAASTAASTAYTYAGVATWAAVHAISAHNNSEIFAAILIKKARDILTPSSVQFIRDLSDEDSASTA